MADKKISAVNLLPEYLRTNRNKKFLSSTIDQLIQKPELERLNGYVGSTNTPTYSSEDTYISNINPYQLDPALVTRDNLGNVLSVQGYDDLINEIAAKGGITDNLDRLFRSKVYSYNAHIDWDKLVNFQNYYWMPYGPATLSVPVEDAGFETEIEGKVHATVEVLNAAGELETVELTNGMMLAFFGEGIIENWYDREFYVEGVGTSIKLIPADTLLVSEKFISSYPDGFDSQTYDQLPFDNDRELPNLHAEYVTISRASNDANPWSRYNRWVHKDVIRTSAAINGLEPDFSTGRAQRPIIEFKPNIQLFNFGSVAIDPVDIFDNSTVDPFSTINGTTSYTVDGVELEEGHRIVFNAAAEDGIRGKIYEIRFVMIEGVRTLTLRESYDYTPPLYGALTILVGDTYNSTDWWYNGNKWVYAQQRDTLNQAPLFDLYDLDGRSYGDSEYYLSNFTGTKIFSYAVGTGASDPHLTFPISYRNINAIGSILFENNLVTDKIVISQIGKDPYTISTGIGYCKIDGSYENAWTETVEYPIPILTSPITGVSYFEEPLSLTNNPLNGSVTQFTISELTQHVTSMVNRLPQSDSPLRDLPDYSNLGVELISNANPISFAQMFIGKKEHNLIDAISTSADNYGTFKLEFLNKLIQVSDSLTPAQAVDQVLTEMTQNKTGSDLYYYSDMAGFGTAEISKVWTVTNPNNVSYPLSNDFDLTTLTLRAVYVYLNGTQLVNGVDYIFNKDTTSVDLLVTLEVGDTILVQDYTDTSANYIPSTPSKLGLYPSYAPKIFVDDTYSVPTKVILGHDGSITLAYNDYRDDIILELEKRIFNNIKVSYNSELFDFNSVIPGAFRSTDYSKLEVAGMIEGDFVKWAAKFSIDYVSNSTYDPSNSLTWNLYNRSLGNDVVSGSYKAVLKWYYDTDRPHTHPWEMLGLYQKPSWWETTYGPAPYTKDNLVLWEDLAEGKINGVVNPLYARPGLLDIIPVDEDGNLLSPSAMTQAVEDVNPVSIETNKQRSWSVGDMGPAEVAWRRSSYYPFAVQRLMALAVPATYASLMYDTSRVSKNIAGQWTYGSTEEFFRLSNLFIHGENENLTTGYSVFIAEIGSARSQTYLQSLRQDLTYAGYNLIYKLGGFADKDTLQIVIDAYEPTSTAPGAILPSQNYDLRFNVSNPILSVAVSGMIIQKVANGYSIRGYDTQQPFFNIFKSIRNIATPSFTIGGVTEKYVVWESSSTPTGSSANATMALSAPTGNFYQKGQYVQYGTNFYVVKVAHKSGSTFNPEYFQRIPQLPTKGGSTVQVASSFERAATEIPYGSVFENIQEVYDVIIGYGRWLESQGFIFDQYSTELTSTLDWNLTAKEFLFWTTQAWSNGSVITLSPFADKLVFTSNSSVVDNLFDSFYEYSVLRADASSYPRENLNVSRVDGVCAVETTANSDGIYFARLNLVQKEHVIIFDNETIFSDTIYNVETGSRQHRVKLVGFRTANWNGDYTSPGFVYDSASVTDWKKNTQYIAGSVVRFNGKYYAAIKTIERAATFDFTAWDLLDKKPQTALLPNFDYKISQFEDFYSLDTDSFDEGQQKLAQHLTGYTPRPYLNNIFPDPIAQYKFYQGYIREKGTKNAVTKLAKASLSTLKGDITFNEEWAFRVGHYGSYTTFNEIEVPLIEGKVVDNPQIVSFVSSLPTKSAKDSIFYVTPNDLTIGGNNFDPTSVFQTTASEDAMLLQHAGYVRLSDVTATAYNENSLLDIANAGQLKDGDTIWLGFKEDGTWDVYKYTYVPAEVVGVFVSAPLSTITFTTQYAHGLSVGQLIGINEFNSQVDGIYKVVSVNNTKQFTVSSSLASIENAPLLSPGHLYVFASTRISDFDSLPTDQALYRMYAGTKFWIDSDNGGWAVYEKVNNYSSTPLLSLNSASHHGAAMSRPKGQHVVAVGRPSNFKLGIYGSVWLYDVRGTELVPVVKYSFAGSGQSQPTGFGSSIVYDDTPVANSVYGTVFAGAPLASNNVGTVQINLIDSTIMAPSAAVFIDNPEPTTLTKFGTSIFVQRHATNKLVLVSGSTAVYAYNVTVAGSTVTVSSPISVTSGVTVNSLTGTDDASLIAIGFNGSVNVYNKSLTKIQTLSQEETSFGSTVSLTPLGNYMFVSANAAQNDDGSLGKVFVYKNVDGLFELVQTIQNPVTEEGMSFGICIDTNAAEDTLVITATGTNHTLPTTFDGGTLTLDGGVTRIEGTEVGTGAAYVYIKKDTRFVYSQELTDSYIYQNVGNNFGYSLTVDSDVVFVGAPAIDNASIKGGIFEFSKKDTTINGWKVVSKQDDFVNVEPLRRVSLIDTDKDEIVEYLDLYDPLKGKIPGIAEQELTYKLVSDPAIYSVGTTGTNNDTNKNWLDDHVGELWWDLSTAKYVWYEQGDLEYRRNNWGKLFPGATIDVYEWVSSTMLPSEWLSKADTPAGIAEGISGQPKFADNSVLSVKQVYDSITNSFTNVYYFWVKNKTVTPSRKDRHLSAYSVASAISDPTAYGIPYAALIDKNALMLSNVNTVPVGNKISLNLTQDSYNSLIPKHTQWALLQEGNADHVPPASIEKKMIDSLLGHDSIGNLIPNPSLSNRVKYGINIRPRQGMFKDRHQALRNIIEFANSALALVPVVGNYSFLNLNAQEEIPHKTKNLYDYLVEDNSELEVIPTVGFERAVLDCSVDNNGAVSSIRIVNPGSGYGTLNPVTNLNGEIVGYQGPVFTDVNYSTVFDAGETTFDIGLTIFKDSNINTFAKGCVIETLVNEQGQVINAVVVKGGTGYTSGFKYVARPHTAFVLSDDTFNGKWTRYEWDYTSNAWFRAHTQSYNTSLYWDYTDWKSSDYDQYQIYNAVIGSPYELPEISISAGQYVKINNGGDGNYIVLNKLSDTVRGTYGIGYDIVFKQNGTIKLSDAIWNNRSSNLNWDYINTYDQTLWDQIPDKEIEYILTALKNDLFINELKVNWNLLFFAAVRYAMTEQKMLDWAFKTSFINVTNHTGELGQPPVYKLQDSSFYENYIEEIKPYHTQIRNFTTVYSVVDPTNTDVVEASRNAAIEIKFDRTSSVGETGSFSASDTFLCNGIDTEFVLNWIPKAERSSITVKLNGMLVVGSDFTVSYYTDQYNGYTKKFAKVVFLTAPEGVLTVSYQKDAGSLNATDRILSYYTSTSGLVNLDLGQLMTGIDYPGTILDGIGFADPRALALDSLVSGGTWENGNLVSALGINPADITIDGQYGFLTPEAGYAPEEVVPGFVTDSLGVNVYTRGSSGPAVVYSFNSGLLASTGTQSFDLQHIPPTSRSMMVICNGVELTYSDTPLVDNLINQTTYNIDWQDSKLVIPPQPGPGVLGYTIIGVGGGSGSNTHFGIIGKEFFNAGTSTVATFQTSCDSAMVVDTFVTVNGVAIDAVTTSTEYGYMLTTAPVSNKCVVNVYNMPSDRENAIQVWLFDESHTLFNEIREQIFTIGGMSTSDPLTLSHPPAVKGPVSAQTIVEIIDNYGSRRLMPPNVNYYTVTNTSDLTFDVTVAHGLDEYPTLTASNLVVYRNGESVAFTYNSDFTITVDVACDVGDSIAIETMIPEQLSGSNSFTDYEYDYRIDGTNLYLSPGAQVPDYPFITNATIKVVTYSNHDGLQMHTEEFAGTPNRRFTMSRAVLDDRYVWVTIFRYISDDAPTDTVELINSIDFTILEDNKTVQISDDWQIGTDDIIVITSFMSPDEVVDVIGYRIFNDMLGGTTYTRLNTKATTYLTQPLLSNDTVIHVKDTSKLTPPNNDTNVPGVVYIKGERIEFTAITSTTLEQLRRGTLGTGPAALVLPGTHVIDQGENQLINGIDRTYVQNTFTNTLTNAYAISKVDELIYMPGTTDQVRYDGIVLSTEYRQEPDARINGNLLSMDVDLTDHIEVYYGGRLLRKDSVYKHDTTVAYDSIPLDSIVDSVDTFNDLPVSPDVGSAYLVNATGKVWVFAGSRTESTSTNGYVYSGVTRYPAEFTIENDGEQMLVLNTATVILQDNIQLTIVKKDYLAEDEWNDKVAPYQTVSLLNSTSTSAALFLKDGPAELPTYPVNMA